MFKHKHVEHTVRSILTPETARVKELGAPDAFKEFVNSICYFHIKILCCVRFFCFFCLSVCLFVHTMAIWPGVFTRLRTKH